MPTHRQIGKQSSLASPRCVLRFIVFLSVLPFSGVLAGDKPDIMLAEIYQQGINLSQYWVSEKLDGVRARWNGKQLLSRGGNVFAAPEWFTKDFPTVSLDGELWMGRRRYEDTSSVVRKHQPHEGWRNIRFMAFDLPEHGGTFDERVSAMKYLAAQVDSPYLAIIKQETFDTEETLKQQLQTVLAQGGEGLMLHRKTARYLRGRSQDLLKLNPSPLVRSWLKPQAGCLPPCHGVPTPESPGSLPVQPLLLLMRRGLSPPRP